MWCSLGPEHICWSWQHNNKNKSNLLELDTSSGIVGKIPIEEFVTIAANSCKTQCFSMKQQRGESLKSERSVYGKMCR
jgi:hypothetical protein